MRTLLCVFLIVAVGVMFGCMITPGMFTTPEGQAGDKMNQETNELKGAHYAKLNAIGCNSFSDMQLVASHNNDFEIADKLIREKRCFVIPTNIDIFIKERVQGDIVSAKFRDSAQVFFTVRSSLGSE